VRVLLVAVYTFSVAVDETLLRNRARDLRRGQTDVEGRLWRELRGRRFSGFKFRRQQPIGPFIVDFCCFEAKVTIELDGGEHEEPEKANLDRARSAALESMGFVELRFWNDAVFRNLSGVLATIEGVVKARHPSPAASPRPLPQGER